MDTYNLGSWEEFEVRLSDIQKFEELSHPRSPYLYSSEFLYRGQSDSSWKLQTTLEREYSEDVPLTAYYRFALKALPQIQAFTGQQWSGIPALKAYEKEIVAKGGHTPLPAYEYFAYLRHHGFPSPLLDWTRSPFIAAYFAFRKSAPTNESVSIFAYKEVSFGGKSSVAGRPHIKGYGHHIAAHRRHFLQQSEYTICTVEPTNDVPPHYASHEAAFPERPGGSQDQLWKFNIPATERIKVLRCLEAYNLNAFSLFGSEESLMEAIALREMQLNRGARS